MNRKKKKTGREKRYKMPEESSFRAKEPEIDYYTAKEIGPGLFDENGKRQYYTLNEFAEKLRTSINEAFTSEVIKENDW